MVLKSTKSSQIVAILKLITHLLMSNICSACVAIVVVVVYLCDKVDKETIMNYRI